MSHVHHACNARSGGEIEAGLNLAGQPIPRSLPQFSICDPASTGYRIMTRFFNDTERAIEGNNVRGSGAQVSG